MGKILLYIAIALTFASAVVGFLNRGSLQAAKAQNEASASELATLKETANKAAADVKDLTAKVTTLTTEKAATEAALTTEKSNSSKAAQEAKDAKDQLTAKDAQIAQLNTDIQAKDAELAKRAENAPPAPVDPTTTPQYIEQQQLATSAMDKLRSTETQLTELQKEKAARLQSKMRDGLEGTILAVNPAWNFVILSLGDRNGVISNSEMLVKRGTQLIGKVRITSVDRANSVADIVANSVPKNVSVQPGDKVIYRSVDDETN